MTCNKHKVADTVIGILCKFKKNFENVGIVTFHHDLIENKNII